MRVLLVDDHFLVRSGICKCLLDKYSSVLISEADSGIKALDLLQKSKFDLALIDLFIPGEKLFKLVKESCSSDPELSVIVLSSSESPSHIRKCLDFGAAGFVFKSSSQQTLYEAIDLVLNGGTFFPSLSTIDMTGQDQQSDNREENTTQLSRYLNLTFDEVKGMLTDRQMEILVMLVQGKPNKQMANELFLSTETVKSHVSAVLGILDLSNRSQAAVLGEKLGLAQPTMSC